MCRTRFGPNTRPHCHACATQMAGLRSSQMAGLSATQMAGLRSSQMAGLRSSQSHSLVAYSRAHLQLSFLFRVTNAVVSLEIRSSAMTRWARSCLPNNYTYM